MRAKHYRFETLQLHVGPEELEDLEQAFDKIK